MDKKQRALDKMFQEQKMASFVRVHNKQISSCATDVASLCARLIMGIKQLP